MREHLATACAAPVTPFTAEGELDVQAHTGLVDRLAEGGIRMVSANGPVAERSALSPREWTMAVETTVEAAGNRMLVAAAVGLDIATAVEAGREAARAGASIVSVHAPAGAAVVPIGWVAYHRAVCDRLPELGVVARVEERGVTVGMVSALADACPNLVGIEYAVPDPMRLAELVAETGDRLTWTCGLGEAWAPFFWTGGAAACTSELAVLRPGLPLRLLHCLQTGDAAGARAVWGLVRPFEALRGRLQGANAVPAVKEALAQLGVAHPTVRPPLVELTAGERDEITEILSRWAAVW